MTDTTAPRKTLTIAAAQLLIGTALAAQNDLTIVSSEVVDVRDGNKFLGKRIVVTLSGDAVDNPTRRYFLRNNSASSTTIADAGIFMNAPRKARNEKNYVMHYALNEAAATFAPPAPAKEVKPTRAEKKAAKQAELEAAAAAAAEAAGDSESEVNAETTVLESGEPVVLGNESESEVNTDERETVEA